MENAAHVVDIIYSGVIIMGNKAVLFESMDKVGIITINRPESNNVIDEQIAVELADICQNIRTDEAIRVVIITGAGRAAFSTGSDLNNFKSKEIEEKIRLSVAAPVASMRCPVIAAINGDAIGQGLELALACDIRIAADKAQFALHHIKAGLIPWDGATQRLQRIIGITKTMQMVLTAETIDAREALNRGLVTRVVTGDELMPLAKEMAQTMAVQSPTALSFAKEAISKGMNLTLEQGLNLEADLYFLLHTTEDRTEGIRAFKEKRSPKFTGN
jgi:enoyl-CoA hydratase/carnithine racemase